MTSAVTTDKQEQEIFDHPLKEDDEDSDVDIRNSKGKSLHRKCIVRGLCIVPIPPNRGKYQFQRVAAHKNNIAGGAVKDEGVEAQAADQIAVQKSLDGSRAAASRTIQPGYPVEEAGVEQLGGIYDACVL